MRSSGYLGLSLLLMVAGCTVLGTAVAGKRDRYVAGWTAAESVVLVFGLSDLAVSTEARYTRHPAVSDPLVPFMDQPAGLEHFPSGSFFVPTLR